MTADWPLEDRVTAIRHELPKLVTRSRLNAYLADRRTQRLRDLLRYSPEHFELWQQIEGEIEAALAWAIDDTAGDAAAPAVHDATTAAEENTAP